YQGVLQGQDYPLQGTAGDPLCGWLPDDRYRQDPEIPHARSHGNRTATETGGAGLTGTLTTTRWQHRALVNPSGPDKCHKFCTKAAQFAKIGPLCGALLTFLPAPSDSFLALCAFCF